MAGPDPTITGQAQLAGADGERMRREVDTLRRRLSGSAGDETKLRQACKDFEAIFMRKLWQQMRDTVPKEGFLHSSYEDQYMGLFDYELSKKMADAGGIGLGDMLYSQLKERLKAKSRGTASGGAEIRPLGRTEDVEIKPLNAEPAQLRPFNRSLAGAPGHIDPASLDQERVKLEVSALAARIEAHASQQSAKAADSGENSSGLPHLSWPVKGGGGETRPGQGGDSILIKTAPGQEVAASMGGRVSFAGEHADYGSLVIVTHENGLSTSYGLQGRVMVRPGQRVNAGTVLAESKMENGAQDGWLHFQVRRDGVPISPEKLRPALAQAEPGGSRA